MLKEIIYVYKVYVLFFGWSKQNQQKNSSRSTLASIGNCYQLTDITMPASIQNHVIVYLTKIKTKVV